MPQRGHHLPHKKSKKDTFDYVVYFFTIATPLFEVPQAIAIFQQQDAHAMSLWTWGFFLVSGVVWTLYAMQRKLKPLLITNILYLIVDSIIVAGIFLYA